MIYTTGTVTALIGTTTVIGTNTTWKSNLAIGDFIKFDTYTAVYNISYVHSDTCVSLDKNYNEASNISGGTYKAGKHFTPNKLYREIWAGDKNWPYSLRESLKSIDGHLHTGTAATGLYWENQLSDRHSHGVKIYTTALDDFSYGDLGRWVLYSTDNDTPTAIGIELNTATTETYSQITSSMFVGDQRLETNGVGTFLLYGVVRNSSWAFDKANQPVYMAPDYELTQTALTGGYYQQCVGVALDNDTLFFKPELYLKETS